MSRTSAGPTVGAVEQARRLLGLDGPCGVREVRSAYRRRVKEVHPDVNRSGQAGDLTRRLTAAYQLLVVEAARSGPAAAPGAARSGPVAAPGAATEAAAASARMVDDDTIQLDAPREEALMSLLEASHRLGEVSYLDRGSGLVEVVVEFQEAPTSSLVLVLQGRAAGGTEVMCTVEPLSGGTSPPVEAVTALLLRTLHGDDPTS